VSVVEKELLVMTSIADYPDEPKYSIKVVSTQTGIRAVTLRAWERRHEILTPFRSDNRYRLYSDRDVAILRWVKNRVDSGISISHAVDELKKMAKNGIWPDAMPNVPEPARSFRLLPAEQYSRQLYQTLIHHDELGASTLMREMQTAYDIRIIFEEILRPCLVNIGEAWYRGEIRITTEHFASAFIRGRLLTLLQAYSFRRNAPYILIGCSPTEQHEIGSLMIAVLLRSNGLRVEYLGPDIPVDDLVDYAGFEHPQMVVLSSSLESSAVETHLVQGKLNKIQPPPIFGFGGQAFINKPALQKQIPGLYLGNTIDEAVNTICKKIGHCASPNGQTARNRS
jgi:MerR family transcriptional regulator, light-induced transcriptional regulator